MTATATKVSQKAVISEKEWVKLFPKNVTENYTSSVTFIKQLTLVAVSMITYLKNAFPEESYSTETFGGLPLKLLNSRCSDDFAQFVSTALQQAWEAFDKKYVHQLALCFYENDCQPENLLEYHIFEYTYNADGVSLNINSKSRSTEERSMQFTLENVQQRTTMLIRMLYVYVTQNGLQELPLNYDVSLRLYYNDDAPEGYQAPGFCSSAGPDHLEPTLPELLRLGWVDTNHHKMVTWSYVRGKFPASAEAVPSANAPAMTQSDDLIDRSASSVAPSEPSAAGELRCPCNRPDAADPATLITCQYCLTQQHLVCFGFSGRAPAAHCCAACADNDPRRAPSDASMAEFDNKKREFLCVYRRTLALCSSLPALSGRLLADAFSLSGASAAKLLKVLQSHYIVPHTDDEDLTTTRKINPIRLKLAFKRFFHAEEVEEDSIVDRLMAETTAAQDDSDPIGEVLSPLEKITLRNSSNLGQIIENPEFTKRTKSDDKTLQQYRDAVMTDDDITEELPLSGSHNPVKNVEKIGRKKSNKRKSGDDENWVPKVRSGAKTKKARTSS